MRLRFTLAAMGLGATITAGCGVLLDFSHLDDGAGGSTAGTGPGGTGGVADATSSGSSGSVASSAATTSSASATTGASTSGSSTSASSSSSSSSGTGGDAGSPTGVEILYVGDAGDAGDAGNGDLHFRIDATEVTVGNYAAFVKGFEAESQPNQDLHQHTICTWNKSVRPNIPTPNAAGATVAAAECMGYDLDTEATLRPDFPIRCIDWCDAAAYCIWAGGYMCRSIEGDATHPNEWKTACASQFDTKYPYGQNYQAGHCVDNNVSNKPVKVATYPGCVGGYSGVFDMSGNVSEWLDCGCEFEGTDPTTTVAYLGGGAYHDMGDDLDCKPNNTSPIGGFRKDVGARCCYKP